MKYYAKPTMVKYLEYCDEREVFAPRYGIVLGQTIICGSDGYAVKYVVHSANPVGKRNIEQLLNHYGYNQYC